MRPSRPIDIGKDLPYLAAVLQEADSHLYGMRVTHNLAENLRRPSLCPDQVDNLKHILCVDALDTFELMAQAVVTVEPPSSADMPRHEREEKSRARESDVTFISAVLNAAIKYSQERAAQTRDNMIAARTRRIQAFKRAPRAKLSQIVGDKQSLKGLKGARGHSHFFWEKVQKYLPLRDRRLFVRRVADVTATPAFEDEILEEHRGLLEITYIVEHYVLPAVIHDEALRADLKRRLQTTSTAIDRAQGVQRSAHRKRRR